MLVFISVTEILSMCVEQVREAGNATKDSSGLEVCKKNEGTTAPRVTDVNQDYPGKENPE